MTEDVRLNPFTVARKCACRAWIIAPSAAIEQTAERVMAHRRSEPHRSFDWDAWRAANTTTEPVRTILRRVA